jgi:iron complex outermembrane receptor protein
VGTPLDTVILVDRQIKRFSTGQNIIKLNDSILKATPGLLTDLLALNTSLFLKQNGYGMVSSPTFRGTTAQQTAVIWNGFNVNSQFTGQADFNTFQIDGFDQVDVRAGGGSVIYGTGAIGGSIHLQNELNFNEGLEAFASARVGSFDTYQNVVKASFSDGKMSFNFSLSRLSSENDYPIEKFNRDNTNGQFEHYTSNAGISFRVSDKQKINYQGMYYTGNRNFSLLFPTDPNSGYENEDHRHLIEWEIESGDFIHLAQGVYFNESFDYFANLDRPEPSGSTAETYNARYTAFFEKGGWTASGVLDYNFTTAAGDNLIEARRNIGSASFLGKYKYRKLAAEISLRQEVSDVYDNPFLFSSGLNFKAADYVTLKASGSRNYRIPTFNDLFWFGAGNPDLLPEYSYQIEGTTIFSIPKTDHSLRITGYYNDIQNLIQWTPNSSAIWRPQNVSEVRTYGMEVQYKGGFKFAGIDFDLGSQYAYTISEDQLSDTFLTYVPKHKIIGQVSATWKNLNINTVNTYLGEVFTQSDNDPDEVLDDYILTQVGVNYTFPKFHDLSLGIQVRNLADIAYQTVENRPMPGRHFFITSTINF